MQAIHMLWCQAKLEAQLPSVGLTFEWSNSLIVLLLHLKELPLLWAQLSFIIDFDLRYCNDHFVLEVKQAEDDVCQSLTVVCL